MASKAKEREAYEFLHANVPSGKAHSLRMNMRSWYGEDDPSYDVYIDVAPNGLFTEHKDPMEAVHLALAELETRLQILKEDDENEQ